MPKVKVELLYPVPGSKGKYVTDGEGNVYERKTTKQMAANKDGSVELVIGFKKVTLTAAEVFPFVGIDAVEKAGDTKKVDLVKALEEAEATAAANVAIADKLVSLNFDLRAVVTGSLEFANNIHSLLGSAPEVTAEEVEGVKAEILKGIHAEQVAEEAAKAKAIADKEGADALAKAEKSKAIKEANAKVAEEQKKIDNEAAKKAKAKIKAAKEAEAKADEEAAVKAKAKAIAAKAKAEADKE